MEALLWFIAVQGLLGAFDMIYHHELTERLPWRKTAALEMKLHGVRNFFYGVIFLIIAWTEPHGIIAWLFAVVLLTEVFITLWDFVEEDRTRLLPATERVTHTVLAINYGAILALFLPHLIAWGQLPTDWLSVDYGFVSWVLTLYVGPVLLWAARDISAGYRLDRMAAQIPPRHSVLAKPNQRILVTGGTGFIGKPLCQELIDQGHSLTILTRDLAKAARHFNGRLTLIESLDCLRPQDNFDLVIDLAGEPIAQRWTPKRQQRMIESRVDTALALGRFFGAASHKPDFYIHASAIGIYGIDRTKEFTEEPPLELTGTFPEQVCLEREKAAEWADAQKIRNCSLRIGLVLETDGGVLGQLLFPFEFGAGGPIGDGHQWMSWIHRHDLIELIIHCINHPELNGAVNATAPTPVPQKYFAQALGRALHRPTFAPMPAFVVRLIFGEMGGVLLLQGQRVIPKKALKSGFHFSYPTIESAFSSLF